MGGDRQKASALPFPWKAFLAGSVILLGLALLSVLFLDTQVSLYFHRNRPTWYQDPRVSAFVQLGKGWMVTWLILLGIWRRGLSGPVITVILSLVLLLPVVQPSKAVVLRTRPGPAFLQAQTGQVPKGSQRYSFPSGDTALAFAAGGALAGFVRRWKAFPLLGAAACIGALRVVSLNHYPSDVMAGAAIGLCTATLAAWIVQRRLYWLTRANPKVMRWIGLGGVILVPILSLVLDRHGPLVSLLEYCGLPLK